jgi:probable HAF family extracellular repeat protein
MKNLSLKGLIGLLGFSLCLLSAPALALGVMTALGTLPGGTYSNAWGINESGQVAGISDTASGFNKAFLYVRSLLSGRNYLAGC